MASPFNRLPTTRVGWWTQVAVVPTAITGLLGGGWATSAYNPYRLAYPDSLRFTAMGVLASLALLIFVNLVVFFDHVPPRWSKRRRVTALSLVMLAPLVAGCVAGLAVENRAYDMRGQLTECRVDAVDERSKSYGTGERNRIEYFDYELSCDESSVISLTLDTDASVQVGDRITVEYDSSGELDPILYEGRWDWRILAVVAAAMLGLGITARAAILWRLRPNSDPKHPAALTNSGTP